MKRIISMLSRQSYRFFCFLFLFDIHCSHSLKLAFCVFHDLECIFTFEPTLDHIEIRGSYQPLSEMNAYLKSLKNDKLATLLLICGWIWHFFQWSSSRKLEWRFPNRLKRSKNVRCEHVIWCDLDFVLIKGWLGVLHDIANNILMDETF